MFFIICEHEQVRIILVFLYWSYQYKTGFYIWEEIWVLNYMINTTEIKILKVLSDSALSMRINKSQ